MSYSGYNQIICAKGHYSMIDCYDSGILTCRYPKCKAKIVWTNSVDTTNGSYSGKKRIDGAIKLKRNPVKTCRCKCGHKHFVGDITFQIPKNKGHKL